MRRVLAGSGLAGLLVGLYVIFSLPVDSRLRLLAASGWVAMLAHDYQQRRAGQRQLQAIRVFTDGSAEVQGRDRVWLPATLGSGCVVLAKLAWIELQTAGGRRHYELLRGNLRENEGWRRFHVIWRHLPRRRQGRLGSSL